MSSQPKTPRRPARAATSTKSAPDAESVVRATKRSVTARANGAKSRGPATPAGRARSSRNSVRHGLAAPSLSPPASLPPASIVLPAESRKDFQILLDSYHAQFAPASGVEIELVQAMAATRWRLRRLQTIETTLLGNEIVRRAEYIENQFDELGQDPSDDDRLADVFKRLADDSHSLALLVRYEGALNRSYDRSFKQLHMLQSARALPQPNEPKPAASPVPVVQAIAMPLRSVPAPPPPHAPAVPAPPPPRAPAAVPAPPHASAAAPAPNRARKQADSLSADSENAPKNPAPPAPSCDNGTSPGNVQHLHP